MSFEHEKKLRAFIRFIVEEAEVIGEPDFVDGRGDEDDNDDESHHDEASMGGVPGPMLPLGMGSRDDRRKRRKDAIAANASGFGGAKPYKNKN